MRADPHDRRASCGRAPTDAQEEWLVYRASNRGQHMLPIPVAFYLCLKHPYRR
jgi:hypothetical protein